ncbi:MAG TPA: hypothetical protein VFF73_28490 [Planctomycetota bacterium]|nr:hypothetical protein [Planctomycetota bacterium]
MRLRLYVRSVTWTLLSLVLSIVLGLLVTSRVIRGLGPDAWGHWVICLQVVGFLALLDLGVLGVLPREVAAARGRLATVGGSGELRALVASAWKTTAAQAAVGALILNGALVVVPHAVPPEVREAVLVAGNAWLVGLPLRASSGVLTGLLDVDFVAISGALMNLVTALASLAVIELGFGLRGLAVVWATTRLVQDAASFVGLAHRHGAYVPRLAEVARAPFAWSRRTIWVSVGQLCGLALNASDSLLIGNALGASQVTVYSCTSRALAISANLPGAATQSAGPFLAEASNANRDRAVQAAVSLLLVNLIMSGWLAACFVAADESFVTRWVGPANFGGHALTAAVAASFVISQSSGALVAIVFYFGNERVATISGVLASLAFLGLSTTLLPRLGIVAVPVAMTASVGMISMPLLLWSAWRETVGVSEGGQRLLVDWLVRTVVIGFFAAGVARHPVAEGVAQVAWAIAVVSVAYVLIFSGFVYRQPIRSFTLDRALDPERWPSLARLVERFGRIALSTHVIAVGPRDPR